MLTLAAIGPQGIISNPQPSLTAIHGASERHDRQTTIFRRSVS
jgi:hypothetical protein